MEAEAAEVQEEEAQEEAMEEVTHYHHRHHLKEVRVPKRVNKFPFRNARQQQALRNGS